MQNGFSTEIFSRVGEEIYIAGLSDGSIPPPNKAGERAPNPEAIKELMAVAQRLLGEDGTDLSDLELVREGLCFRPVTRGGVPILAKPEDEQLGGVSTATEGGVYICAGHGPWGISLSLGTGLFMSQMIESQKTSADARRLALR